MQLRKAQVRGTVQRVGTKEQFMQAVRSAAPDCIIADAAFPRLDVAALMAAVKGLAPSAAWVLLAASAQEEMVVGWMRAGAADVVTRKNIGRMGAAAAGALAHAGRAVPPAPAEPAPAAAPLTPAPPPAPPTGPSAEEAVLRTVLDHAGDMIALLDGTGGRLYSNPVHQHLLDAPEHLRGTVAFVDVHPEDRRWVTGAFHAGLREGRETRIEYRVMDNRGRVRFLESVATPVPETPPGEPLMVVVSRDVSERTMRERDRAALLQAIGSVAGAEFFAALVTTLARVLGVRYALISECVYQPCERVRSLAYVANGALMPSFEYDIADTTCEAVFSRGEAVHYEDSVQDLFPRMHALATMGARSYLGYPLVSQAGGTVGHMFLIDDRPLEEPERAVALLDLCAPRAALEVERHREDATVRSSEARLRSIINSLADGVIVADAHGIITYLNETAAQMGRCSGMAMIGKPLGHLLTIEGGGTVEETERYGTLVGEGGPVGEVTVLARPFAPGGDRPSGTVYVVRPVPGGMIMD